MSVCKKSFDTCTAAAQVLAGTECIRIVRQGRHRGTVMGWAGTFHPGGADSSARARPGTHTRGQACRLLALRAQWRRVAGAWAGQGPGRGKLLVLQPKSSSMQPSMHTQPPRSLAARHDLHACYGAPGWRSVAGVLGDRHCRLATLIAEEPPACRSSLLRILCAFSHQPPPEAMAFTLMSTARLSCTGE